MSVRQFHVPRQQIWYQSLTDHDQQIVFDGESYRSCTSPDAQRFVSIAMSQYREIARMRMHNREFGDYLWERWAREDGVLDDLVQLGRSLIREADQHNWCLELQEEYGWNDSGAKTITFA